MKILKIVTNSVKETEEIGFFLGETLQEGSVLALIGDLGSGKTAFTKGIARGLGVNEEVTSPTYILIQEYEGCSLPLYHADVYRLLGVEDLDEIGLEDLMYNGKGVVVVEWAEKILPSLPDKNLQIEFEIINLEKRKIIFKSQVHSKNLERLHKNCKLFREQRTEPLR